MKRLLLSVVLSAVAAVVCTSQTVQLIDINPAGSSYPFFLVPHDSCLFLIANDGTHGYEPMAYYGSGMPALISDVNPGSWGCLSGGGYKVGASANGKVYFQGNDGITGAELFCYSGGSITLVADLEPGGFSSFPNKFLSYNNMVYFTAYVNGVEKLYSVNAVNNVVQQISTPSDLQNFGDFCECSGKLYFAASQPSSGIELYCYDPQTNVIMLTADIEPGVASSGPQSLIAMNNKLYFSAATSSFSRELYSYDGISAPVRLTDLVQGSDGVMFGPNKLVAYQGKILFSGITPTTSDNRLYIYDTATNTATEANVQGASYMRNPDYLTKYNGKVFFSGETPNAGAELCAYNGNNAYLVADIYPGSGYGSPMFLKVWNNSLYMAAYDTAYNEELFKYSEEGLGITNLKFDGEVRAYPNPVSHDVQMEITPGHAQELNITITNALGKNVHETGVKNYDHKTTVVLPMQSLSAGVYFYSVTNAAGLMCASGKLVKE